MHSERSAESAKLNAIPLHWPQEMWAEAAAAVAAEKAAADAAAEKATADAAMASGPVLAPRPARWTLPLDASALAKYVTLHMGNIAVQWDPLGRSKKELHDHCQGSRVSSSQLDMTLC